MSVPSLLEAARVWRRNGFAVIPVLADGTKRPAIRWAQYQDRAPTEEELSAWFECGAAQGLAVVCGAVSGGVEVLDFDDPAAFPEWERAVRAQGLGDKLDACPLVHTPSGGMHVYYRSPAVAGNQKLAMRPKDPSVWRHPDKPELEVRIETRGEGGYVIAPPSNGCVHPDGGAWTFVRGKIARVPTLDSGDREVFLANARSFDETPQYAKTTPGHSHGTRPGDLYNLTDRYLDVLMEHGWRECGKGQDGATLWARPGKAPDEGHSATCGYEGRRGLYVFSSSAHPFELDRHYDPFEVLALLDHGGDFSAAARDLADQERRSAPHRLGTKPNPTAEAQASDRRPVTVCMADVAPERVEWLWTGRVPRAKLTVLDGDPGLGKSVLTLDLAARLTQGAVLPGDDLQREPVSVLLLSAEDGKGDTIRPRLDAARPDLHRVHLLQGWQHAGDKAVLPISLPTDLDLLYDEITRHGSGLVVIDPLMAHMAASVDSHKDQDVRLVLARLAQVAEATGAAIVLVRHLNKMPGGRPIYRGGGSMGIIGAARSGLLVGADPNDTERRVIAPVKSNLARMPKSLAFRVTEAPNGAGCIVWEGECPLQAPDLLGAAGGGARMQAEEWLRDMLSGGPVAQRDVQRRASAHGIAKGTLARAKTAVGVESKRTGYGGTGEWTWQLADDSAHAAPDLDALHRGHAIGAQPSDMSAYVGAPNVLNPVTTQLSTFDDGLRGDQAVELSAFDEANKDDQMCYGPGEHLWATEHSPDSSSGFLPDEEDPFAD